MSAQVYVNPDKNKIKDQEKHRILYHKEVGCVYIESVDEFGNIYYCVLEPGETDLEQFEINDDINSCLIEHDCNTHDCVEFKGKINILN